MNEMWHPPPTNLQLLPDEVHVWRVDLQASDSSVQYLLNQVLAPDEVERARRFHFEKDRSRWIVARALLRLLLSRYDAGEPKAIRFSQNGYGKLLLVSPVQEKRLHFNISHSADLALYAFTFNRELGIDIEYMRAGIEIEELARYSFSAAECTELLLLPAPQRHEAFFRCWTRKEAYIKARGMGLSLPLDQFDVSLSPGSAPALLQSREDPREVGRWTFHELSPGPGYSATLVVEGAGYDLRCYLWPQHK